MSRNLQAYRRAISSPAITARSTRRRSDSGASTVGGGTG
nr:MAG TPA: hypothetical protein [Bacteriophage sp.]